MRNPVLCCVLLLAVPLTSPAAADVLVSRTFEGRVVRMDEVTGEVIPGWEIDATMLGGLLSGVAVSDAGVVYVTSGFTGSILQFDLATGAPINGGFFAQLPDNPPAEEGGDPVTASPGTIKIGPDGLLYVADNAGTRVHRYDPADGSLVDTPVSGLIGVGGLGFRADGELLSTNFFPETEQFPNQNAVYLGAGSPPAKLVDESSSTLFGPNGVLVNADDSFMVADLFGNRIVRFDADGAYAGDFASVPFPESVNLGDLPPGSFGPVNFGSDLARAPNGDVLVVTLGISSVYQGAAQNYGELLRFDASGKLVERLAVSQSPMGAMALVPGLVDVPSDFNRDAAVDHSDYAAWRDAYGRQVTPNSHADGNGDGLINAADYTRWRDSFSAGGVTSAAPEPAAAALLLAALAAASGPRRR